MVLSHLNQVNIVTYKPRQCESTKNACYYKIFELFCPRIGTPLPLSWSTLALTNCQTVLFGALPTALIVCLPVM